MIRSADHALACMRLNFFEIFLLHLVRRPFTLVGARQHTHHPEPNYYFAFISGNSAHFERSAQHYKWPIILRTDDLVSLVSSRCQGSSLVQYVGSAQKLLWTPGENGLTRPVLVLHTVLFCLGSVRVSEMKSITWIARVSTGPSEVGHLTPLDSTESPVTYPRSTMSTTNADLNSQESCCCLCLKMKSSLAYASTTLIQSG
jgi:hypothetical protein